MFLVLNESTLGLLEESVLARVVAVVSESYTLILEEVLIFGETPSGRCND